MANQLSSEEQAYLRSKLGLDPGDTVELSAGSSTVTVQV